MRILADRYEQRIPFPLLSLCWQDSRSVLAVKGSLRRARRALDCSGPIGEQDLYEGKGITGTSRLPTARVSAVSREFPPERKRKAASNAKWNQARDGRKNVGSRQASRNVGLKQGRKNVGLKEVEES